MSEFINNVSQRKKMLKEALAGLHEGRSVEEVQEIFAELVKVATYDDIAEAEQMLIAEGLPAQEIQKLCDLHVAVVREALDATKDPESQPGHPVHTMRAENQAVDTILQQMAGLLTVPGADSMELFKGRLDKLREYECHYVRKENLLFPLLERYEFTGPSQVMWGIHDEIRRAWKALAKALANLDEVEDWQQKQQEVRDIFLPMQQQMEEMIYKEEKILIPASLERLNAADWSAIYRQEPNLGTFMVNRGTEWQPLEQEAAAPVPDTDGSGAIPLQTGLLTAEQLDLMLTNMPFDITFVDENDEVRYFTQGKERIFPREANIIGRKVQLCHPPQSLDKVQEILDDFRSARRDVAEFWIQMGELFVHIRYYALRDAEGSYKGCIEVSQDIAPLRALEGEKRLLDG